MLQEIKDYMKCTIKNKFVIGGYVGAGLSLLAEYITYKTGTKVPIIDTLVISSFSFSTGTLILNTFGLETTQVYRIMREHIKKHGTIKSEFKDKFTDTYCTQIGIKMAAKEADLENLV